MKFLFVFITMFLSYSSCFASHFTISSYKRNPYGTGEKDNPVKIESEQTIKGYTSEMRNFFSSSKDTKYKIFSELCTSFNRLTVKEGGSKDKDEVKRKELFQVLKLMAFGLSAVELNQYNQRGQTIIHQTVIQKDLELLQFLVENGVDCTVQTIEPDKYKGSTVVDILVGNGEKVYEDKANCIAWLISKYPALQKSQSRQKFTSKFPTHQNGDPLTWISKGAQSTVRDKIKRFKKS